jgi:hypothetical protein
MELSASTVAILLFVAGLMWLVPRRYMIAPYILTACLIPASEEIVILGFNFQPARVLVLIGMVRALLGEAARQYRFVPLDGLILLWGFNLAAVSILREPTMQMFVRQTGVLYEIFGMYFLARLTIQSRAQVHVALTTLAVCALVSLPLGILEVVTRQRPLAIIYQTLDASAHLRENKVRVYSVFPQAIAFGNFMCVSAALLWGQWRSTTGRQAMLGLVGMLAAIACAILSNSGTTLSTLMAATFAILLFYYRPAVRYAVWGVPLFMASYHFFWPGGQWWGLVARASSIVGGSGFHRAELIKQFWLRIDEWALKGSEDVTHWNIVGDPANHWVTEGLKGGLLGLILFTAVVVMCFIVVGRALKATPARRDQALFWAIGCGMFAFCVSFIGLANFGQINVLWFGLIGMIGSVSESLRVQRSTRRMPAAGPHSPHPARPMHAPPGPPPPPTERTGVAYD